jgi:hypothetical protein
MMISDPQRPLFFCSLTVILALVCLSLGSSQAWTREMRTFKRIITPQSQKLDLPDNAERVETPGDFNRDIIKESLEQMNKTWNSPGFSDMVSDKFYDKAKLNDAMAQTSKYGTTLKLEGMQNIQVLDQYVVQNPDGTRQRVSKVSAVVRTRSEFEDGAAGKVSSPGTNEIIFEVKEKLP